MADTRNQITYRYGVALDLQTAALWALMLAKFPGLIITQGVRSGATASAGTHRGLGVVDFYLGRHAGERTAVLKYAFEIGFFGWYRSALPRVWAAHVHLGVRGNKEMAASLKVQEVSWRNLRNGLQGNGPDSFTWRPANYKKAAPWPVKAPAKPKPPKAPKPVKAWFNGGFLNAAGNNSKLFHTFDKRLPKMVALVAKGKPAIQAFAEVQPGQRGRVTRAMAPHDYRLVAKDDGNMLAVYAQPNVTHVGYSFSRFSQQDGGNIEGVLRVKFRVDGSRAQVGVVHLDVDSSEAKKRSNLRETYAALRRYGAKTLLPDWKSRTIILGDFNDKDVAGKVLAPLGFKAVVLAGLDQIWVGAKRKTRGGKKIATSSTDHPYVRGYFGRS